MRSERKEKRFILFLLVAVVFMTVGFAAYEGALNINGTVKIQSNKWSVLYDSASYQESADSVAANSKTVAADNYTFDVTLSKPGDFYEATVAVKNDGTFGAEITGITMSTLTEAQQKYLTYTVTYDGTTYTETNDALALALNAGESKDMVVKVAYIQPADSQDLPSEETTVTVTGSIAYKLAE